jgi:hypothetical protein
MGHARPSLNRWLVVVGAILIQLALGAIYAWSVFTARLTDAAGAYAFSASETAWVFSSGLATARVRFPSSAVCFWVVAMCSVACSAKVFGCS